MFSVFSLLHLFLFIGIQKAIPEEVWACGPSTRALDISNNFILDVPAQIGSLSSMQVNNIFSFYLFFWTY